MGDFQSCDGKSGKADTVKDKQRQFCDLWSEIGNVQLEDNKQDKGTAQSAIPRINPSGDNMTGAGMCCPLIMSREIPLPSSGISIHVPLKEAGFPPLYYKEEISRTALEDTLLRRFSEELEKISFKAKGSGKVTGVHDQMRTGNIGTAPACVLQRRN